jgi:hypothetical protein
MDERQTMTITTIMSWSSLPLAGGEERSRGKNMRCNDGDNNDGDNNDGENDDKKINSKSTFCPPQSRKGTGAYSACILGIRLCYQCHGAHIVTELKWA